jgi:Rrf2 family iron-sulfur cluster assembly transcriptional regulator
MSSSTLKDVQMTLGSKGDYAVRAMLELTRARGRRRTSGDIAATMQIPPKYLPQVLSDLIKAGLVDSMPGPGGGYSLARQASDISLLDVVEAAEGPVTNSKCLLRGGPCYWEDRCSVHDAWSAAQDKMIDQLRRTSFASLARHDAAMERARLTSEGTEHGDT